MNIRLQRILILFCFSLFVISHTIADNERIFYVYNAADGLADNSAQTINCTKTGRLVITTMGQINFFDGQHFSYIDPTTENTYPLSKYNGHSHIYFDKYHHLWLKKRHSLTCVNLTKEMFVGNIVDEFHELGMDEKVADLFCDGENRLYLLTEKGLYSVERKKYFKVSSNHILQDLAIHKDKYLLLFYENGQIDALDLSTGSMLFSERAYDENLVPKYNQTTLVNKVDDSFYQIRNGVLNGVNYGILLNFNVDSRKWEKILETPYYLSNIKEHDSILYVPSAYGYWTYDMKTHALEHVEKIKVSDGKLLLTDINCLEFDKQGGMWIGTEKRGLLYCRPFTIPFNVYGWENSKALELAKIIDDKSNNSTVYREKTVNCVFHDSRGWDWVGTSTGLQLYRNNSARLPEIITRNDGLLNNVIHCIVEDNAHNIWVGTSYGICCLFIEKNKIRFINRYNQHDGIPSESFVNGRSVLLDDGTILMQALDHVISFNPNNMATLRDNTNSDIFPKLIRMFVNGNDIRTGESLGGKVILEKALTRTKVIDLDYNQNSVSLTFSGLNYFRPQQTYYRVRVKGPGMSNKWEVYTPYSSGGMVDNSGQLHLPMPSLVPGTYSIEVQASMLPDDWHTTPYEWIINVNEPWWRTTGVFALGGLVLLVLLITYLYMFLKNANLKARRNSEEQNIIKRIKSFADRCNANNDLVLEPLREEVLNHNLVSMSDFSQEFIDVMQTIIPVMTAKGTKLFSMRELSNLAGMKLPDFYQLITSNIYKNPRPVAMQMMLSKASELLKNDADRDMEDISKECGFVSPNYFISSFYHKFNITPMEFRKKSLFKV